MFVFKTRDEFKKHTKYTQEPRKYIILDDTDITDENMEEIKEYRKEYEENTKTHIKEWHTDEPEILLRDIPQQEEQPTETDQKIDILSTYTIDDIVSEKKDKKDKKRQFKHLHDRRHSKRKNRQKRYFKHLHDRRYSK
jgi:hypothetical protein